jgi:hypothetical protein
MLKSCIIALLFLPNTVLGQQKVSWETLAGVTFSYIQNYDQNFWYGKPSFSEEVKALEGQKIEIEGYIIPGDVSGESYYLSAFPFSACFFCGGAGQESIMELRLVDEKASFTVDEYVTLTGVLRLNDSELELNYILEEAKVK